MANLSSKTRNKILVERLGVARTFWERGMGLMGRKELAADEALLIDSASTSGGLHTLFMRFAIDCVFVNRDFKVQKIYKDVRPWRMVPPVLGARAVVELPSGAVDRLGISLGEELHVGA